LKRVEVTIHTELATISLTNEGGAVKRVALDQFNGPDREPPVLITDETTYTTHWLGTEIEWEGVTYDLSKVEFKPDRRDITCGEGEAETITFAATLGEDRRVIKKYTFYGDRYDFDLTVALEGFGREAMLGVLMKGGIVPTEAPARQIKIFPFSFLARSRPYMYFKASYLGRGTRENPPGEKKPITEKDGCQRVEVKKEEVKDEFYGTLNWAAVRNKYFTAAVMIAGTMEEKSQWRMSISAKKVDQEPSTDNMTFYRETRGRPITMKVYTGPLDYETLKSYGEELDEVMELSWRFVRPISVVFLKFLKFLRRYIPNYGIVIIVFSVLLKVLLHPITKKSTVSMAKMQEIQPKVNALKEKYKGNKQKLNQETMKLYREHGVNPVGGCLPALLPLPVFLALYPVIDRSIEMRQANFISFWIDDLSRPDPYFIMPVLMGITMFLQNKMTMKDPSQKGMLYVMPIFMVVIFLNFSAGLVLYWSVFSLIGFVQQIRLMRQKALTKPT